MCLALKQGTRHVFATLYIVKVLCTRTPRLQRGSDSPSRAQPADVAVGQWPAAMGRCAQVDGHGRPKALANLPQAVDIPAGHGRRPIGPNGHVPASSAQQRMSTRSRANCDAKRPCGVRHAPKAPAPHWAGAETALGRDPLGDAAVVQREVQAHPRMNKHSPGLPISHSTFQSHESLLHVLRGLPGFSPDSPHPASPPRAHPIPPSQIESLLLPEIAVRESSEGGRWKPSCIIFEVHRQRQMLYCGIGKRRKTDPCITHHRHRISLHPVASVVIPSSRQEVCAPESRPGSRPFSHPAKGPEISFLRPFSVSHPSNQYGTAADVTSAHAHGTAVMGSY